MTKPEVKGGGSFVFRIIGIGVYPGLCKPNVSLIVTVLQELESNGNLLRNVSRVCLCTASHVCNPELLSVSVTLPRAPGMTGDVLGL